MPVSNRNVRVRTNRGAQAAGTVVEKNLKAQERRREQRQQNVPKGWEPVAPAGVPGISAALTAANLAGYTKPSAPLKPVAPAGVPGLSAAMSFDQAIKNAFGITPSVANSSYTQWSAPNANRNYNLPLVRLTSGASTRPDYSYLMSGPKGESKTVTERYMDWLNSVRNQELGYQSYLFPTPGATETAGGGGGGYGYGGGGYGGGGYGGGGYNNADYSRWLRDLLTRWNIG